MKIIDIEGIGPEYAKKLQAAGINTVEELHARGRKPKGRLELEQATGIGHKLILEWVNHADLIRINGVGSEYADLLEEAGVDTVKELGNRVPENLLKKMTEINTMKDLVRRLPTLADVEKWVNEAKTLPDGVEY